MNYNSLSDIIDFELLKISKNFAIKSYKDSIYRGERENSDRVGKGIMTYTNGRVYEGEWL